MQQTLTPHDRDWAMYAHLGGLLALTHIPFANIIGPLIVYLKVRDESEFATYHAREALNFQITFGIFLMAMIAFFVYWLFAAAAASAGGAGSFGDERTGLHFLTGMVIFGFVLLAAGITNILCCILGAIAASAGRGFRYPINIPFVR